MTTIAELKALINGLHADEAYHRDVYQQFAHDADFARMENCRRAANSITALIAVVEVLRDACSVGQIVGGSKMAAQVALAPFGENDEQKV